MYKCELCGFIYNIDIKLPFRCGCQAKIITNDFEINNITNTSPSIDQSNFSVFLEQNKMSYQKLWEELHTYKYINEKDCLTWLENWEKKLPCGECRNHWAVLKKDFPPDVSSAFNFFKWGVEAHNLVSNRLNLVNNTNKKHIFTLFEAIERWGKNSEFGV